MSIDYYAVCEDCESYTHLGQFMGGKYSFGFGSGDAESTPAIVKFIADHLDDGHSVWTGTEGDVPEDYKYIDNDALPKPRET